MSVSNGAIVRAVLAAGAMMLTSATTLRAQGTPQDVPACLPGEMSADDLLNGRNPFPPSPQVPFTYDEAGLDRQRLGKVPAPGVHPRVLISPDQLPDLRRRLSETAAGKAMMATLRERTGGSLLKAGTWENEVYNLLAAGEPQKAVAIMSQKKSPSFPAGHYQPNIPYALVMEAFDTMVSQDAERGKKVAAAIAGWAMAVEPAIDAVQKQPLYDDVWRAKLAGPATGSWESDQGLRDLMGNHLMGYAYDFAFNYMTPQQQAQVRRVIAKSTAGRVWLGVRLPQHFRNWNWVNIGLSQPLLALAIEGEEGYDERVYRKGVEIARDYLTYGISKDGCSTEAVGYTQFGFVWGAPFMVAASRRGEPLIAHSHHRAMLDWYLHSMEPQGATWTSHGDGGDGGPAIHVMSMWKYFYPDDPRTDVLWKNMVAAAPRQDIYAGRYHIIEPLLYACDPNPKFDDLSVEALKLPERWFDPERSSLIARSGWEKDAAAMQFECRTDSHGPSHEHADRGAFTFSALGRVWAKDNFRSIETRHHNSVLVDGKGQGFWPGPGRWVGQADEGWAMQAACDAKDAYDWWWPKQILTDKPDSVRFNFARWDTYKKDAAKFARDYAGVTFERDTRPAVVKFWQGFETLGGGPRLWDEDGYPVRASFNPVQKAFRTVVFVREPRPYLLVVDDIRKDDQVRLYEWLMQTGLNTDVAAIKDGEITLCDAGLPVDADGKPKLPKGARQLVVRTLSAAEPTTLSDYNTRPSARLELFERKDTTDANGRTFGPDKRLVIPSRSVEPGFKVLLLPVKAGEAVPETRWNDTRTAVTLKWGDVTDELSFTPGADGRTRVTVRRGEKVLSPIEEAK